MFSMFLYRMWSIPFLCITVAGMHRSVASLLAGALCWLSIHHRLDIFRRLCLIRHPESACLVISHLKTCLQGLDGHVGIVLKAPCRLAPAQTGFRQRALPFVFAGLWRLQLRCFPFPWAIHRRSWNCILPSWKNSPYSTPKYGNMLQNESLPSDLMTFLLCRHSLSNPYQFLQL